MSKRALGLFKHPTWLFGL